jgi:head-tail adaptor
MLQSKIRRGELDREVTFIKPVKSVGQSNEDKITSWIEVATDPTVMMRKRDVSGNSSLDGDRDSAVQQSIFTGDYRTDITTENRMVCEGQVFEIVAVTDNNESRGTYKDFKTELLDTEVWT